MVCFYVSHASISSILIVIILLSLSTINATKPNTCPSPTMLISKACKGTAAFSSLEESCLESLTSDPRTASASSALELFKAVLSLAMEKAEHTQMLIGSPKKPCFKSCAENYKDSVVEGLKKAEKLIEKGQFDDTDVELSLARDAADYCNMILSVDPDDTRSPVFKANMDVYYHITFVMSVADLLQSSSQ